MKVEHLRKLPVLLLSTILIAGMTSPVFAAKPYFKTYGSDVMTGGAFEANGCSTSTATYQNPAYIGGGAADDRTGGILAFAKEQPAGKAGGGASSQYADYSLGYVEHDNAAARTWGFYSMGANIANSLKPYDLTFANKNPALPAGAWGGMFEGSVPQSHCIPDYYAQKPAGTTDITGQTLNSVINANKSYSAAPAAGNFSLTNAPLTVPLNARIRVFVKGNIYINNDITYDAASAAGNVPKLQVIASGSIYIGSGVHNLDGWYIAQPDPASPIGNDTGVIWTCHPDAASVLDTYILSNCASKLTVNGALVAKRYVLDRLTGDVASATTAEDASAAASGNSAEVVNFTPAMVIGGGFTDGSTGSGALPIDSLISLPPVF